MTSLGALAKIRVLYVTKMLRVQVLGDDPGNQGDAPVFVSRQQELAAGHDVVGKERGSTPQIDQVHAPAGGTLELRLELVELEGIRGRFERHSQVEVAPPGFGAESHRTEEVREAYLWMPLQYV